MFRELLIRDAMLIALSYHNLIAIEYKNNSNIITDIIEINNEVEKMLDEDFDDSDFEIM